MPPAAAGAQPRQATVPVERFAAASPAFAAVLATHKAVLQLAVDHLQLTAVHHSKADSNHMYSVSSADGSGAAAAEVEGYRGSGVHWLSASTLVNSKLGFGTTRLLGFVGADRDVPHFALEQVLSGDKMQGIITLWPRQPLAIDLDYLHKYYSKAPSAGMRSYNELYNAMMATSEERHGWRHYTSPVAEVKPLLASSIAYTFPADHPENLEAFQAAALEVVQLWAGFLQAGGGPSPPHDEAALHKFDARYFSAITSDPANTIAVRLFGEEATNILLKMSTGHPAVQ